MNAVASAVNITTGNAFMTLNDIELFLLPYPTCAFSKATFATYPTPFHRITDVDMPIGIFVTLPFTRDDAQIQILILKGFQGTRDKTLSTAIRTVFLADQGQSKMLHGNNSLAASMTG